jgi:energy-coupling factor transporter ATP-binding protein EcfA2
MVVLPLFKRIWISNYGLFPGHPPESGIDFAFQKGVSLIAGINGLGKTTLVTALLRLLTGPSDLSSGGLPLQIGSTLPEQPAKLRPDTLRFFAQRVADATTASASLELSFGDKKLRITRRLQNLKLTEFTINERSALDEADPEGKFQASICQAMNLSSFVDVLLLLHFVVFFPERRPGALWDANAQRHLLRAIFLPKKVAANVADLERQVGSADSSARNLNSVLFDQKKRLAQAEQAHAAAPALRAELGSLQTLLDADLEKREAIESQLNNIAEQIRAARLNLERAKIEREDAERALERIKFGALSRMFPDMEDVIRLTILNLISKSECLVCGASDQALRNEIEQKLQHGICPVCNSPPEAQFKIVKVREVEAARIRKTQQRAALAGSEEDAQNKRWIELTHARDTTVNSLQALTNQIDDLQVKVGGLKAQLPTPTQQIKELRDYVNRMQRDVNEAGARRAELSKKLREAFKAVDKVVIRNSDKLSRKFSGYCEKLLSDEVALTRVDEDAGIAQAVEQFMVPLFEADMAAAARPGLTRRSTANDVSESQRELIDLAFRFALIEVATDDANATLVMETPESSLDGVSMERVGKALCFFASKSQNRLIATSNLSNAGIISFLFGGKIRPGKGPLSIRLSRTINLLEVAAKNQALINDTRGRYSALLRQALEGRDGTF